jgi:transposase
LRAAGSLKHKTSQKITTGGLMERVIGLVHKTKVASDGKIQPTAVMVSNNGSSCQYEISDDEGELDFILGRFPTSYRQASSEEDLSSFHSWQIKPGKEQESTKVPEKFDGLRAGDRLVMVCGGSGDRLAYAAANRLRQLGGKVLRLSPFRLKAERNGHGKDNDHVLLTEIFSKKPGLFQEISTLDLELIRVKELYFQRIEAMKARIGCQQRLRQRFIGQIFLSKDGLFPEGAIEERFDALKDNDVVLSSLLTEERKRELELKRTIKETRVWKEVFKPIEGLGEMIAARLIAAIGDIRRFETESKFIAYCGLHVLPDGSFPRRRNGEICNWQGDARQGFYLLCDQFNRRPDSIWGKKLRENKTRLREKHPETLCQECGGKWDDCQSKKTHKRIYSQGHIHKMAQWRTMTRFARHLYREWRKTCS